MGDFENFYPDKKYVSDEINELYQKQIEKQINAKLLQDIEDHKYDDIRKTLHDMAKQIQNCPIYHDVIQDVIVEDWAKHPEDKNQDGVLRCAHLSKQQILYLAALILQDEANGYIQIEHKKENGTTIETIPFKDLKKITYLINESMWPGKIMRIHQENDIKYELTPEAPKKPEIIFAPWKIEGGVEMSLDESEALLRRARTSSFRPNKKKEQHDNTQD